MFKNFNYYYILACEDFWFYVNNDRNIDDFYYSIQWRDL